jgi:galactose mutarotase-like enzyme
VQVAYDAPHMGIWQLPGAPYLCIEPWWGLPDYDHSNGVLAQKDGIVKLDAGETFVSTHTIRVSGTYR